MKQTSRIVLLIVAIAMVSIVMSMAASAYVPPEKRMSPNMNELQVVELALAEHDAGNAPRWVTDIIEDAEIHHTNSGRSLNNHAQLRQWVAKVNGQKSLVVIKTDPTNLAPDWHDGKGWCRGYDAQCRTYIGVK